MKNALENTNVGTHAKVEFEKYIGSIKSVFDVGGACSNVECSLTLDELLVC